MSIAFPLGQVSKNKTAVKLHTLLDLRGNLPVFVEITEGKHHDVNILDVLIPEAGSFYIMDRGYIDFRRLELFNQYHAFFVIRAKNNLKYRRLYSHPVDRQTGLRCDQIVALSVFYQTKDYPDKLRRIRYFDTESQNRFTFLTNNFTLDALTIANLFKYR